MSDIALDQSASDPATPDPAPVEPTTETIETPALDDSTTDVAPNQPDPAAPEPPAEASMETSIDDDPFAEFDANPAKDKAYYDDWFKSKVNNTPNIVRQELFGILEQKQEADTFIDGFGGRDALETFKPVIDAILSPNSTPEQVDTAFEAIDNHNPLVMRTLGEKIAKDWIQEVAADPVTHVTPLLQHTLRQVFGEAANDYTLDRIMEFVQLDLARDLDGDPVLDLDYARSQFETAGGYNAFRHQQEKAAYERQIKDLQRGSQPAIQQNQPQQAAAFDVDKDLETDFLPKAEAILAKVGYTKTDAEYNLVLDALRYRMRNAPEAENIRGFAKAGAYKLPDGKYAQGVVTNRNYLERKLQAQILLDLKAVQSRRKGSTPTTTTTPAPAAAPQTPTFNAQQQTPANNAPKERLTREEVIQRAIAKVNGERNDAQAAAALAAGR